MQPKQLCLLAIDGMHILRRVYEAARNEFPESLQDSEIHAAKSVDSAIASLRRAIKDYRPTHAMLAMDVPGEKNWRHEIFPDYKANRDPMPEALRLEVDSFSTRAAEDLGIAHVARKGVEADDLIASAVTKWCTAFDRSAEVILEPDVIIMTTDKDIHALISDRVVIRDHFVRTWHDEAYVQSKFGVKPNQISDYLALIGDKVDNIPGVANIGPKTAEKLLERFGSIDSMLSGLDALENKRVIKLISDGLADLELSRSLTHMRQDIQFGRSWKDFRLSAPVQPASETRPRPPRKAMAI